MTPSLNPEVFLQSWFPHKIQFFQDFCPFIPGNICKVKCLCGTRRPRLQYQYLFTQFLFNKTSLALMDHVLSTVCNHALNSIMVVFKGLYLDEQKDARVLKKMLWLQFDILYNYTLPTF